MLGIYAYIWYVCICVYLSISLSLSLYIYIYIHVYYDKRICIIHTDVNTFTFRFLRSQVPELRNSVLEPHRLKSCVLLNLYNFTASWGHHRPHPASGATCQQALSTMKETQTQRPFLFEHKTHVWNTLSPVYSYFSDLWVWVSFKLLRHMDAYEDSKKKRELAAEQAAFTRFDAAHLRE